jgi:peptidyl-prolyl cis-trans isomerase B (cyclophilin B)
MKRIFSTIAAVCFIISAYCQGIDKPRYIIETHRAGLYLGTFEIELFPLIAPLATNNFDSLVNVQFYDSTAFHRVVPGFVIQGGDPNSIHGPKNTWGQGNPNQPTVNAEFSVVQHLRGRLGAARDVDTNSANSQFYICVAPALFLDGDYTVYGQVTSGMEVVDTIVSQPRDGNDNPLQKIEMFITKNGVNDSIPDAPVLISPADNTLNLYNGQVFKWSKIASAVMYTLEFSTDSQFTTIAYAYNSAIDSIASNTFAGSTKYYWRVKSNNGGHTNASSVFSFTTAMPSPLLIYPADTAKNVVNNPTLVWDSVPGAVSYTLQVSKFFFFVGPVVVFDSSGLTSLSQQVSNLIYNKKYYWRVRGFDGSNEGNWSKVFAFTTGTNTGIVSNVNKKQSLKIDKLFPNPTDEKLNIELSSAKHNSITISIKDLTGKAIYNKVETSTTGKWNLSLDTRQLSKGMYLLHVFAGNDESAELFEVK